jgi:hypothetical protein
MRALSRYVTCTLPRVVPFVLESRNVHCQEHCYFGCQSVPSVGVPDMVAEIVHRGLILIFSTQYSSTLQRRGRGYSFIQEYKKSSL